MVREIPDRVNPVEDKIYQVTPRRMALEVDLLLTSIRACQMIQDMGQLVFTRRIII